MKSTFSFLAGALSGALVGAVAALLLAPMSGERLQIQAREQFDHVMADARAAAESKRAQLEAQLAALKRPAPAEPTAAETPVAVE
jgi:gas vesicle protein